MRSVREGMRVNLFGAQAERCRTKAELVERGPSALPGRGTDAKVVLAAKMPIVSRCHDQAVLHGGVGGHKSIWPRLS